VARVAGVSPATVSRVLNHPEIVRPDLQAKVRRAVTELGYAPDAVARALSLGRSSTIGAVVPTLAIAIFADGTAALQRRLREHGYTLLIASSEYDPAREIEEVRVLLERGVDGLVLVGDSGGGGAVAMAQQYGVPVITTYVSHSLFDVPAIGIDNADAMYHMVEHLLALGHTEFGIITDAAARNDRTEARRQGIVAALEKAAIRLDPRRIAHVSYSVTSGREALRRLITSEPDITAVICTSDALAIGALAECQRLGLVVPRDLSITGYDDIDIALHTTPPLTTVNVPANVIGRLAADHLVGAINGWIPPASTKLPTQITIRGSTARPRSTIKARQAR
jgi:LacI family transcriptional regulator